MNSTQIFELLEAIAANPKKNEKERLLKENDCPELREVLVAAYDPLLNYYLKKIPTCTQGDEDFTSFTWAMLNMLSSRNATGHDAIDWYVMWASKLNAKSQELLARIVKRDLRAGFSESTINKAFPSLIQEFPYMQYTLFSKVKSEKWLYKRGVFVQTKMDGAYAGIDVLQADENVEVSGLTRQGTPLPETHYAEIFNTFKTFSPNYQYHGEVLVEVNGKFLPREEGNGIANSIAKGGDLPANHKLIYVVWDMVETDTVYHNKPCRISYEERFSKLSQMPFNDTVRLIKTDRAYSREEAFKLYAEALARGEEGVMVKNATLLWKDHKTTDGAKLKLDVDVDLRIKGFTQGEGKNAALFGAVTCHSEDSLLVVNVSGFTDDMRKYIHENRENLLETIMCVKSNDIMLGNPASLFLPRFAELRFDKQTADTLQQVIDQFENAKAGK